MKKMILTFLEMAFVVVITVIVFQYIVIPVRIDGHSMENSLHDQDIALIHAWNVQPEKIQRFDVAVIKSDELNENIIKRVIGLPGETIEFKDDILYVNGVATNQDFLDKEFVEKAKITYNAKNFTENFKVTLAHDEYFMMGDNRLRSTDSRVLGSFKIADIKGVDGIVIFPFSSIQYLL